MRTRLRHSVNRNSNIQAGTRIVSDDGKWSRKFNETNERAVCISWLTWMRIRNYLTWRNRWLPGWPRAAWYAMKSCWTIRDWSSSVQWQSHDKFPLQEWHYVRALTGWGQKDQLLECNQTARIKLGTFPTFSFFEPLLSMACYLFSWRNQTKGPTGRSCSIWDGFSSAVSYSAPPQIQLRLGIRIGLSKF